MKKKLKKLLPRILALCMVIILAFGSSEVINVLADFGEGADSSTSIKTDTADQKTQTPAVTESESIPDGSVSKDSYVSDPNCTACNYPGFIIKLVEIDNIAKDNEEYQTFMQEYNKGKELSQQISECQLSAIELFLHDYPDVFRDNTELSKDVLIRWIPSSLSPQAMPAVHYRTASGDKSAQPFKTMYTVDADDPNYGSWYPYPIMSGIFEAGANATSRDEFLTTWFDRGMLKYSTLKALPEYYDAIANHSADIENNIKSLFVDIGTLDAKLNNIWSEVRNYLVYGTDIEIYRVYFLDFLLALDEMAGRGTYANEIDTYLKYQNANGADKFVIPMIAACTISYTGSGVAYATTLADFYGYASGQNSTAYLDAMGTVNGKPAGLPNPSGPDMSVESLVEHRESQMSAWFGKFHSLLPGKAINNTYAGVEAFWWSKALIDKTSSAKGNYELAFSVFPTDWFGRATGNIGYTYLALGGGAKTVSEYPFNLTAETGQVNVSPGGIDISTKQFLKVNEIFAQLFSVGVFHEKGKLTAEDLTDRDSVEETTIRLTDGQNKLIERLHDVMKLARQGMGLQVILAIEQQTAIHYYMPVRCMVADAIAYDTQCRQKEKEAIARGQRISYVQGVPKGTKILPVISLVFYTGSQKWDGLTQLYDMFEVNDENCKWMENHVHNYGMHIIDARHMTDEEINCFEGDMKAFLIMLKDSYSRESLENVIAKHRETWYALSEIKKDNRYKDYIDSVSDKELEEGVTMCATLDYYETKGKDQGKLEGKIECVDGMIEEYHADLEAACRVANISVEEYRKYKETHK